MPVGDAGPFRRLQNRGTSPNVGGSTPMKNQTQQSASRIRWWQWPNLLGLDAPVVAVGWMALIARSYCLSIPLHWPHFRFWFWDFICLCAAVWAIYLADRLLDSYDSAPAATDRHAFARRNRRLLYALSAAALAVGAFGALWKVSSLVLVAGISLLSTLAFYFGLVLMQRQKTGSQNATILVSSFIGAAALLAFRDEQMQFSSLLARLWFLLGCGATVYLALLRRHESSALLTFPKKLLCGYLFAAGCALIPSIRGADVTTAMAGDLTLLLALICSLNTVGISIWEMAPATRSPGHEAELRLMSRLWPLGFLFAAAACGFLLASPDPWRRPFSISCLLSLAGLGALHAFRRHLSSAALRVLADVALLTPFVTLPIFDFLRLQ